VTNRPTKVYSGPWRLEHRAADRFGRGVPVWAVFTPATNPAFRWAEHVGEIDTSQNLQGWLLDAGVEGFACRSPDRAHGRMVRDRLRRACGVQRQDSGPEQRRCRMRRSRLMWCTNGFLVQRSVLGVLRGAPRSAPNHQVSGHERVLAPHGPPARAVPTANPTRSNHGPRGPRAGRVVQPGRVPGEGGAYARARIPRPKRDQPTHTSRLSWRPGHRRGGDSA